jgi:hypothetical protein
MSCFVYLTRRLGVKIYEYDERVASSSLTEQQLEVADPPCF